MTTRRTRASAAAQAASSPPPLNEDVLIRILRAAKAAGVLTALASSSRQLCTLARSSVRVKLSITNQEQAALVIASQAQGRPPFSGCKQLHVKAADVASCLLAAGVVYAAKQWTALQDLRLDLNFEPAEQLQPGVAVECYTSNVLCSLPALQQLRHLDLEAKGFGTCSAERVAQLPQLTALTLRVRRTASGALPNLSALCRLTNLVRLHLYSACVTQPAAGPGGSYHLPSSLTRLVLHAPTPAYAAPIASWASHLPGCPQLQEVHIQYGRQQHASAHPAALVRLLAQHNRQLRILHMTYLGGDGNKIEWSTPVAGLPDAAGPVSSEWRPDDALAALTGLQVLSEQRQLCIRHQADWQHLAQLTALSTLVGVEFYCAPAEVPGATLRLLELTGCEVYLHGRELGCVLLACPLLKQAKVGLFEPPAPAAEPAGGACLSSHPCLKEVTVAYCCEWGEDAAGQFAALAPVLSGVECLVLTGWPHAGRAAGLPDLSPCTALVSLVFGCEDPDKSDQLPAEQEAYLSMLAPLGRLQSLVLMYAPRVDARVAVPLQYMLPQLQKLELKLGGTLLPDDEDEYEDEEEQQQEEAEALNQVVQLLRPGLRLTVTS